MCKTIQDEVSVLSSYQDYSPIVPYDLNADSVFVFDFSTLTPELEKVFSLPKDKFAQGFTELTDQILKQHNTQVGFGKYNEDRVIYQLSELFNSGSEIRTVHLGIDIWVSPGTPVMAPLAGKVHSFNNNANFCDYGPTIILEHELKGRFFYALYGHLSLDSLDNIFIGKEVKQGATFAHVGSFKVNGGWPPHLHFQIMKTMLDKVGDFPGVASLSSRNYYTDICLNPNLIIKSPHLV